MIELLNNKLGKKNPYLLLGPGRWGTADPWLGIPVQWDQITNTKSIIEIGIEELNPDPSFGSHFFQNIANLRIGYFTISKKYHKKYIDWKWIKSHKNKFSEEYVNVISLDKPLFIKAFSNKIFKVAIPSLKPRLRPSCWNLCMVN